MTQIVVEITRQYFHSGWIHLPTHSGYMYLPTQKFTKYLVNKYSHCWVDEINRVVEYTPNSVNVLLLIPASRVDFQCTADGLTITLSIFTSN